VRLWDLKTQRCSGLIRVPDRGGVPAVVTAFTSAWPSDSLIVAGTASGLIHVLDTRLASRSRSAAVVTLTDHSRYIVGVSHARAQSPFALVSGSVACDVRSWDLRISRCVHAFNAHSRGFMTALAHHDYAPLLATGSARQQAKVFSNSGDLLADVRFHESFSGQRIGQVSALAWHPHRLMLAIGATDSMIDIYG
jgi:regulator-associated protein of mTOR